MVMTRVKASATATAHQIPLMSNTIGSINTAASCITSVLRKDMHKYFHLKIVEGVVLGWPCGYNNRHGL